MIPLPDKDDETIEVFSSPCSAPPIEPVPEVPFYQPDAPAGQMPAEDSPSQQPPGQESAAELIPAPEMPAQDASFQEAPSQQSSDQDGTAELIPAQEMQGQDAPVQETPSQHQQSSDQDGAAEVISTQQMPVQEAPGQQLPDHQAPDQEAPSQEIPALAPEPEPETAYFAPTPVPVPETANEDPAPLPATNENVVTLPLPEPDKRRKSFEKQAEDSFRMAIAADPKMVDGMVAAAGETYQTVALAMRTSAEEWMSGFTRINTRLFEFGQLNAQSSMDFMRAISGVRSVRDAVDVQSAYLRGQYDTMASQLRELQTLTTEVAGKTTQPFKEQMARATQLGRMC